MNTESKTLRNYQSFLKDESRLDASITQEDMTIRVVIGVMFLYGFISFATKDFGNHHKTPLISSADIIFGVIFFVLIFRSVIRLHSLYVLKSVLSFSKDN